MSEFGTARGPLVGGDAAHRDSEIARDFLLAFAQLIQVSRYHELDNVALEAPLGSVAGLTEKMCRGGRRIHLLSEEDQIFVNRRRVRLSTGAFQATRELTSRLLARGAIGLEIHRAMPPDRLRAFLEAFHGVTGDADEPADRLEDAFAQAGLSEVKPIRPGAAAAAGPTSIEMDESRFAALLYAKAVVILRENFRCWQDDEMRGFLGARAKRVVQQMISLVERTHRPFLWLVHVKNPDEYLFTHSANVALLSILMGSRIELDRNRVCDLGMAALFHDMGRLGLPPAMLTKQGEFSEAERRLMRRHPIQGVNLLLELGALNTSLLDRLIVVFEHNIEANGYPRETWPGGLHLFSRIVAIADAYDAMTTIRGYRPSLTPAEAIRDLTRHAGSRYDTDLVNVFVSIMGVYPLGTLVRLDTGEAGLVFHVDPARPGRPLVKLVRDSGDMPIEDGEIVDLGQADGPGHFARSITGTEDAIRLGVNVPAYLTEDVN